MAELINLRAARKRAKRQTKDALAQASRLAHGQPKRLRQLETARKEKADRDLDGQRIEPGGGR